MDCVFSSYSGFCAVGFAHVGVVEGNCTDVMVAAFLINGF